MVVYFYLKILYHRIHYDYIVYPQMINEDRNQVSCLTYLTPIHDFTTKQYNK